MELGSALWGWRLRGLRMAVTNIASVQIPRPVFWSGVRLAVNETPHGPAHAVFVAEVTACHRPLAGSVGGGDIFTVSG